MLFVEQIKWCTEYVFLESLGRGSGADQAQPPFVPGMEPVGRGHKVICVWLPPVLDLEVLSGSNAVLQGELSFVPSLSLLVYASVGAGASQHSCWTCCSLL